MFLSHRIGSFRHRSQKGQAIIESLMGIILFTIMLALIMSITMWLYVQQAMVTSAREGARQAALNSQLASGSTRDSGVSAVKAYIKDEVVKLTGLDLPDSGITVTGPTGAVLGQRTVKIDIALSMKNPIGIAKFMSALGATNTSAFDVIPVNSTATLRYEE